MPNTLSNSSVERYKIEVAACTRLLNNEGILEYSGHVSVRLPDRNTLLIQSFDASRTDLTPDELFVMDLDGKILDGPSDARPVNEVEIHSEVLRARADVNAVLHYHPNIATLFTMVEGVKLVPMKNHAYRWGSGIPTHPESWHIDTLERGRAMAETLGKHHAVMLRAHGAVIASESIPTLMVDAVHFEENAKAMYDAARLGTLKPLTSEEITEFAANFKREKHAVKLWRYFLSRGLESGAIPKDWGEMLAPTERV
ncbi:MAG: class II aldolase/adducin family protein [candidate division NC10 bacterium]|jgi:ribulose-5-phosphate 4-epimerase/fuculose-1-phosphate aldolase